MSTRAARGEYGAGSSSTVPSRSSYITVVPASPHRPATPSDTSSHLSLIRPPQTPPKRADQRALLNWHLDQWVPPTSVAAEASASASSFSGATDAGTQSHPVSDASTNTATRSPRDSAATPLVDMIPDSITTGMTVAHEGSDGLSITFGKGVPNALASPVPKYIGEDARLDASLSEHMVKLHLARDKPLSKNEVVKAVSEIRDFLQTSSGALASMGLPVSFSTSPVGQSIKAVGGIASGFSDIIVILSFGALDKHSEDVRVRMELFTHTFIILSAFISLIKLRAMLQADGLVWPMSAVLTPSIWWPLADSRSLRAAILQFRSIEMQRIMNRTHVPWSKRKGAGDRKLALFLVESLYVPCVIASVRIWLLAGSSQGAYTIFAFLLGIWCIINTHQIIYLIIAANAPQPEFLADDLTHPFIQDVTHPLHKKLIT
mgnify:CR=1 FL=1